MTRVNPHRLGWACIVSFAMGLASPSQAQDNAASKAAAEALFEQAREMLERGETAAACEKLTASYELDEGLGTLLYLADCYEQVGRTASAWATFKEAMSKARAADQPERARIAEVRAAALEPVLVSLVVSVDGKQSVSISIDDVALPDAAWGSPYPVDPGEVVVRATAPGRRTWSETVKVPKAARQVTVKVPELEEERVAPVAEEATSPKVGTPQSEEQRDGGDGLKTFGLVIGGVGIAGLVVGSVLGFEAKSKNDESLLPSNCRTEGLCNDSGLALRSSAQDLGLASTVVFAASTALLATGAVLFLVAPDEASPDIAVGVAPSASGAAVAVTGTF